LFFCFFFFFFFDGKLLCIQFSRLHQDEATWAEISVSNKLLIMMAHDMGRVRFNASDI